MGEQGRGMFVPIQSFQGEFWFLSNFYIESDGTHVEGEYQAAKCRLAKDRRRFVGRTPGEAKILGMRVLLRDDWEYMKLSVMRDLVTRKFGDHPILRHALRETGERALIEGNHWGDRYWGVCAGQGENHLGKILMAVRDGLRWPGGVRT